MATAPPLVGKLVYRFEEGDATQRKLLGGKGSNLCEMAHLGLPVPPGFVIHHPGLPELLFFGPNHARGIVGVPARER